MTEESKQHVQVPDPKIDGTNLKPTDYLVYANIRRYMNKDTLVAFPSLKTISTKAHASIPTVRNSIKKLSTEGLIEVITSAGKPTMYKFKKLLENFEMFTPEFLDSETLSPDEKAYLIGLQAKAYKTENFAISTFSNKQLANELHLSLSSVQRLNKSLKEKNILKEIETAVTDNTGLHTTAKAVDLHLIGQAVLFINQRVDDLADEVLQIKELLNITIKNNENLTRENKQLQNEIRRLKTKDAIY